MEKFRYGVNRVAKKSLSHTKSPDIGIKNAQNIFQKNPQICFLGENPGIKKCL
jgi:hypothetical protein